LNRRIVSRPHSGGSALRYRRARSGRPRRPCWLLRGLGPPQLWQSHPSIAQPVGQQ